MPTTTATHNATHLPPEPTNPNASHSPIHAAIQAVVERRKQTLRPDLLLRPHAQLPRQQLDRRPPVDEWPAVRIGAVGQLAAGALVVPEHAGGALADGVIVKGEVRDAEQGVQLQEFEQIERLCVGGM